MCLFPLTRETTWEQTKTKSEFFSIKRTTVTQLRPHLRMVSSYGHSQAADTQATMDRVDRLISKYFFPIYLAFALDEMCHRIVCIDHKGPIMMIFWSMVDYSVKKICWSQEKQENPVSSTGFLASW